MIISHKHRYLFIEVPHTGTTAIAHELRNYYAGEKILDKHANYTEFRRQASRDELNYFVFAGVRNPLDVVVTDFFKYRSDHKGAYSDPEGRANKWVSREHIERFQYVSEIGDFAGFLNKFYNSVYNNWFLIGHRRFDYVMRFENIQAEFAAVLCKMDIKPVRPLPVVNKSARPQGFAELYSPEMVGFAVRIFGPFMREWGYAFPKEWRVAKPPLNSRIAFRTKDSLATLGSRFFTLSGKSRGVQLVRRLLDVIT